jgi:carboxyl-terminal processing protease
MVKALGDPYTVFLPPGENEIFNEDLAGQLEGVGILIGFKNSQLVVMSPLADSPAAKAGIKAGDAILGIIDKTKKVEQDTAGISLPEAVNLIRGKAGTKVSLILSREGKPEAFTVEMTRVKLDIPSVVLTYTGTNQDVVWLKLLRFGGDTTTEWEKNVQLILSEKRDLKGIVLDLRNNPGGYMEAAVDIAGEFLKTGSLVVIENRGNGSQKEYRTQRVGRLTGAPLVVLVNGGSASAAEILAGALKDNQRAKLVGETTFGKGSVQEPLALDGDAGLHVTVARWLTPNGFWVNQKGLEPDVKIEQSEKEDTQLNAAVKLLE